MALGNTVGKFTAPAARTAAPARTVARKSKYAGIAAQQPRDPMPAEGVYRFEVVECRDNPSPKPGGADTFKAKLRIVAVSSGGEGHKVGDTVVMLQMTSGPGAQSGLARVKSFIISASGYESEDEYDAFDPEGKFIEACCGEANEYTEQGLSIDGRYVDCRVSRGRPRGDDGDYYREYTWFAVPDSEQPKASA